MFSQHVLEFTFTPISGLAFSILSEKTSKFVVLYRMFICVPVLVGNSIRSEFFLHDEKPMILALDVDGPPAYQAAGPLFDSVWTGPFKQARPIQQTSALDLFLAGLSTRYMYVPTYNKAQRYN